MENSIVTLNISTPNGVVHKVFNDVRNVGDNRYILFNGDKTYFGTKYFHGLWKIVPIVDVFDSIEAEKELVCKEV